MAINNKRHSASNKRTSTSNKHNSTNMTGTESNLDNTPATTTNSDDPATEIEVITDDTSTPTTPSAPSGSSADTSIVVDVDTESEAAAKKRKLTSKVWDHFQRIVEGDIVKAICNYCTSTLSATSTSGTNHLRRHADDCFTEHGGITTDRQTQLNFSAQPNGVWIFSQDNTRHKLAEMIVRHEYAFNMVKHPGFITFMQTAQPKFVIPGRMTVRNDCVKLFTQLKAIQIAKMAKVDHISLTTDLWTSSDLTGYMVVTAHYIDEDFALNKSIISFRPLLSPHTGQVIADRLSQVLIEWGALNKLAFITLDNASSNNLAVSRLQRFINNRSLVPGQPATSPYFHVRCLAHVINLVVKDGLKQISGPIERLRESVKYIRGSSSRMEGFERALVASNIDPKKKHPSKDVPTRWNATYLMIESSLPLKLAFQQLGMDDDKFEVSPSSLDWEELAAMKAFLKPFYEATLELSGTKYPTMNHTYRMMRKIEIQLSGSLALHNSYITEIIEPMKEKFLKYWKPMQELSAIGLVLDPPAAPSLLPATATPSASKPLDEDTSRFLPYMNGSTDRIPSNAPGAELDLYLEERNTPIADRKFDILAWWKMNGSRFPALSKLAKVILMTPVTSVASESAFSTGGRVLDDYRSRLNEETVEALLCAQDWIKASI
ncbi:hypothetical protein MJO28_016666 [Puccinia striiformis f. sp. tritici]|uniref:Uncharacterized protein n=1 Tax=Puccinia striiformis f. sp. tritici TaxID=168172 RepID=A0ACC0DNJ9_9BASI|nr:hypothetical protein MJO28_016666 [Puccinia striiformis f. sp. tritici]